MASNETIDAIEESHGPSTATHQTTDPARNRPMSVKDIQEAYAKYASWIDRFGWMDRLLTGRYRRQQFRNAAGRTLDVACGTGSNFRYLPESVELIGIDISEEMLARARTELDHLDREGTVRKMDAQALEFDDDSFETVISSFSTCTFPDPVAALREMERVCEPDGQILLVEHGRSDNELIARYQEWRAEAHYQKAGCRVTQEPLEIVRQAGLPVESADTGQFGRITAITSRPSNDRRTPQEQ